MPIAVTENKFTELKAKLRELFELDKSDLDFGIYRIMAAKNKEVTEFLDRQLKDVVRQTLTAHGAAAADQVQAELNEAVQQAQALGADPDTLPKVAELKAKLAAAGGDSAAELEADIYNHLLAFFSRYYDEGDFISKRRYKGDVYAVPYNGEEVTLYWANKDQYYIKSGEWHKDYRFKAGGKTVHFKLVEATQETNNNKEPDDAKRRYMLAKDTPVESTETELTLRFEFRVPTEAEKQAVIEATRIFGGKYAAASGRTKGDEREQFCADAEQRAIAAMPDAWKPIVTTPAPTDTKPARTLLGKHLEYFTARNTFDYFIHKDLGGFLNRELDFYIKNEVVRLDDLESLPADHLARVQGKIKAIRTVASRIITFLASIENFQKKMWLKKKFVLETNWLVTIDRIPPNLREAVAANPQQWAEWEALGFKPADGEVMLLAVPKWGTRDYLDVNDKLVVDTRLYGQNFKFELLAKGILLEGGDSLDLAISGVLINSDNQHALSLLRHRYEQQVKCVYIDPPFNLGESAEFAYKVDYRDSTWCCLLHNRFSTATPLLGETSSVFTRCGHDGNMLVRLVMSAVFGAENFRNEIILRRAEYSKGGLNKQFEGVKSITVNYENIYWYSINPDVRFGRFLRPPDEERAAAHWHSFWKAEDRPNMRYELLGLNLAEHRGQWMWERVRAQRAVKNYEEYIEVAKGTKESLEDYWRRTGESLEFLRREGDGFSTIKYWIPPRDFVMSDNNWTDIKGYANRWGFKTENSELVLKRILEAQTAKSDLVLDYFLGSGTTAAAAIKLGRKFIGIEMGPHFSDTVVPRAVHTLFGDASGIGASCGWAGGGIIKYFALESYEDALNNLPAPTGDLLAQADPATKDAFITYSLDLELGPNLLNMDAFRDPWGYCINAQPAGEAEIIPHRVDMVETFNYLLGLKVHAYGPIERYAADFQRAAHPDNLGRVKVTGRLRRDQDGPFVFQRVEGELLDGTRVLVVWRKLNDNAEQDAAALEAWMNRHREQTKERSEHRDYHLIYINGPVTLPQPTAEIRTVLPIEQTFKDRMFEDEKGL